MIVLGIDPGITTGFAYMDAQAPRVYKVLEAGTAQGYKGIWRLLDLQADIYVVENFTLWPALAVKVSHDDPELLTTRYIGAITSALMQADKTLVFQQPQMKKACPDFMLREFGLWKSSSHQTPHERDAMRHVIVYARRQFAVEERERRKQTKKLRDAIEWQGGA